MKKIYYFLLLSAIVALSSCYKSSSDPITIYTVKYEMQFSGDVLIDTVAYKDLSGATVTKMALTSDFDYSFTAENSYDAYLYVSGRLINGSVSSNLIVKDGSSINYEDPQMESWEGSNDTLKFQFTSSRKLVASK